jgi:hypothetical protein
MSQVRPNPIVDSILQAACATILISLATLKVILGHDAHGDVGRDVFYLTGVLELALAGAIMSPRLRLAGMTCTGLFGFIATVRTLWLRSEHCGCFGRGADTGWRVELLVAGAILGLACHWIIRRRMPAGVLIH